MTLNLNGEFPLTSAGAYVGNQTYPNFPADLATIRQGTVKRVTLSIGSSNYGDWEDIKALVDKQGTGPDSILYKDFAALKAALPVDAVDFDDENGYDPSSTTKFAVMLGKLGYHVTMDPYTNNSYWILGRLADQCRSSRHGGRRSSANLCGRRGQHPLLRLGFRRRPGLPRHFRPILGTAVSDPHADTGADAELAHAVRHHRWLGLDLRSDRGHQPGPQIRARDHQGRCRRT